MSLYIPHFLQIMCRLFSVPSRCDATVTCSPFLMSLPLFRVLLTTAHMQVCTVIRFSPSRFVPPNKLFLCPPSTHRSPTACWSVTIPADLRGKLQFPSWFVASEAAELSSLIFPQHFPLYWTLICTLLVNYGFLISLLPFLFFLSSVLKHPPCPLVSSPLYNFSSSAVPLCLPCCTSCISDGLPPIWPRLSLWRAVQHLSETFSEGRTQQRHVCTCNTYKQTFLNLPCTSLLSNFFTLLIYVALH